MEAKQKLSEQTSTLRRLEQQAEIVEQQSGALKKRKAALQHQYQRTVYGLQQKACLKVSFSFARLRSPAAQRQKAPADPRASGGCACPTLSRGSLYCSGERQHDPGPVLPSRGGRRPSDLGTSTCGVPCCFLVGAARQTMVLEKKIKALLEAEEVATAQVRVTLTV